MAAKSRTRPARRRAPAAIRPKRPLAVDCHAHIVVPEVFEITARHGLHARLGLTGRTSLGPARESRITMARMVGTKERLADMDRMGIDIQVISPSIVHQSTYWADGARALEIDRMTNDGTAEMVASHPDRLVGLGLVPLHDPARAVREMTRCVTRLGLRGVAVSTVVNGLEIGDRKFRPFWRAAEKLDCPVFIHPAGNADKRLQRFGLSFNLGQPYEEALAMSSLVYEGIMDRFPKLKPMIVHGGGFLPYYAGRHDSASRTGRDNARLKGDFSGYFRRFYYDTVLFNPDMLEVLATKTPTGHIMMGTDWPFGERRPIEYVRRARKISRAAQDAIIGRNAARLFKIAA
jgi:aminocarboxymuconate-semialdehyde decarboxylase